MRIALTGNPNSGKTTMYNALTGRNEKTGNWAGVTVDRKEALLKRGLTEGEMITVIDLPGAYSMSPFTAEESITRDYIKNERPDAIINIVDATNLSRSLFFTTQLLELGVPVVVALNKTDVNEKKATKIDTEGLSRALLCPVVETSATTGAGLDELVKSTLSIVGTEQKAPYRQRYMDLTDKLTVEHADRERFAFVNELVKGVERRGTVTRGRKMQDTVDMMITDPVLGTLIFAVMMFLVFQISQVWVGPPIADFLAGQIDSFRGWVEGLLGSGNPFLSSLLLDGIIGGVGAVVGFLPLVMVMYFLIALLEDCGYMARVSVVLDPIFKKVGLSGKAVIPFVIGIGCAIPGVMASRTLRSERERRSAAMLAPFMPCGAKIPVIALFAGAFFENAGWVSTLMYLTGIVIIFVGAMLINLITGDRTKKNYFIIELPEYKIPSLWNALTTMCSQGWAYVVKAATIILVCNTAVQIMQSFDWRLTLVEDGMESASILASIAVPFAWLLIPVVGVLSWQLAAAAVTGFIAKENVVGTLAVCFGISGLFNLDELSMVEGAGGEVAAAFGITKAAALAYLMFNLYTPPCFAAIGAMNAEMKSGKWLLGGIAFQLGVGFTVAFLVYQIGTVITEGTVGAGFVGGLLAVLIFAAVIIGLIRKAEREIKSERAYGRK